MGRLPDGRRGPARGRGVPDSTLWRVDPATDTAVRLCELAGDTPERLVVAGGSLWATSRGADLLRVDPATGKAQETIAIGTGGIDLVATDEAIRATSGRSWPGTRKNEFARARIASYSNRRSSILSVQ